MVPSIREITIYDANEMTTEEGAALMNKLPTVNTFNLIYDTRKAVPDFKALRGNEWQSNEEQLEKTAFGEERKQIKMTRLSCNDVAM